MSKFDELYYIEKCCFSDPWTGEMLEAELNSPLSILEIGIADGKTAAYAIGRVVADEAELFRVAVLPEFRRQGIAEKLLASLHRQMKNRGARSCFLEVRKHNLAAVSLYKKLGYELIREISGYYPDDDALVMRCEL